MSTHIFIGPSLEHSEVKKQCSAAVIHGPVRLGDLSRLDTETTSKVVIIDGVFEFVPSVWHKEILVLLEAGIPVFGASSMGALRAVELKTFGMLGHGWVVDQYLTHIDDDDEVALVHADVNFDYQGLSIPLINLRYILSIDVLAASQKQLLKSVIEQLKLDFYPDRTLNRVAEILTDLAATPQDIEVLFKYLTDPAFNIKRLDAISCIKFASNFDPSTWNKKAVIKTEKTVFLQRLQVNVTDLPENDMRPQLAAFYALASKQIPNKKYFDKKVVATYLKDWFEKHKIKTDVQADALLKKMKTNKQELIQFLSIISQVDRHMSSSLASDNGYVNWLKKYL